MEHPLRANRRLARRRLLALLLAAAAAPLARAAASRPLQIGVMPYLSTAKLIAGHQPLRHHIEKTFGRPAVLSTAPDFPTFQQRTLAGEYDLVVTGPPLAWAAYKAGIVMPVAIATRPLRVFVAVARNSPIQSVTELRGKTVGVLPPPSFAPAILTDILRSHGLVAGTDVELHHDKTPYNSVKAVTIGELAAAAYPSVSMSSLPQELLDQVRTIHTSADFPAVIFCARLAPDLPSPEAIQAALFAFVRDTAEGKTFVQEFGHDALAAPDLRALKILDRFLPDAR
jgi:phosphonate transport system substrate-binding protein